MCIVSELVKIKVGLVFRPSWSKTTTVVVSELTASLPIWAMSPYAQAVLDHFKPAKCISLSSALRSFESPMPN